MLHPATIYAFDYSANRTFDRDGRMRVNSSILSAAQVDPYWGDEIPNARRLGLDPTKTYQVWRHPEELAKAAPTFNGLQILARHIAVNAQDHRADDTVGAAGTNADFTFPYLRNSLTIWAGDAISRVVNKSQHELSCAYGYDAEVKSGVTSQGQSYDVIMRNIVGNHVALVEKGRVGPKAVVGDGILVPAHISNFIHDPRRNRKVAR